MSNPSEKEMFAATIPSAVMCRKCSGLEPLSPAVAEECVGVCKCGLPIWRSVKLIEMLKSLMGGIQ